MRWRTDRIELSTRWAGFFLVLAPTAVLSVVRASRTYAPSWRASFREPFGLSLRRIASTVTAGSGQRQEMQSDAERFRAQSAESPELRDAPAATCRRHSLESTGAFQDRSFWLPDDIQQEGRYSVAADFLNSAIGGRCKTVMTIRIHSQGTGLSTRA